MAAPPGRQSGEDDSDWSAYGGDAGGNRFSSAAQIDRSNVKRLQVAWDYRTGELGRGFAQASRLSFETTPLLASETLYLSTPTNIVIALDPAKGTERWRYDPHIARNVQYREATSRGVASWFDPKADGAAPCSHRIFIGTLDARLIAIDGRNGQPCNGFGIAGVVDLMTDVRVRSRGADQVTSPPAIYRDLVIVGAAIGDRQTADAPRGLVRAFDTRTGQLRWSWAPPAPGIFSVDAGSGLLFVPTGTARGDDAFANSLVALQAQTGVVAWQRQLVHRDLWDYDLPAQPMLVEFEREGKSIAAVVQATRTGQLFIFDRDTGEPVFDVIERHVPRSDAPGIAASLTQPFPVTPALVSHAAVTPQDAWGLTFVDRGKCADLIGNYRSEGIFTPPSLQGTIVSPGSAGGVNWGSLAFDSERQLIVAAVNHLPSVATLVPASQLQAMQRLPEWAHSEFAYPAGSPYALRREALLSPLGLPCTAPPWGTLAAVDLRRNSIRWQVVLGSTRDATPWYFPKRDLGMPNAGGPMIVAGGLAFIAAATDNYLRAFDMDTGSEMWRGRLPAGGQATPMSYEANGRQFVVIAAGGNGGLKTTRGDHVVAFALPE